MATITDYTTPTWVRATLGVADYELPDSDLTQDRVLYDLELELGQMSATLVTTYVTLLALPSRTETQEKFIRLVKLFSTYHVALYTLSAFPQYAAKSHTDGRVEDVRQDLKEPLTSVKPELLVHLGKYRQLLLNLLPDVGAVATVVNYPVFTLTSSVGLATDPVTGT